MVNKQKRAKKRRINEAFEHHWDECFGRVYPLTFMMNDTLMAEDDLKNFDTILLTEKEKLNTTKSLLNNIDIQTWRAHTTHTHKCGLIVSYLKKYIKAEFVTQAWAKLYAILNTFDFFSETISVVNSVHLCEAPGAFVSSLNHYLQSRFSNIAFNWVGATLNPYYEGNIHGEMIVDDRFIIETLSNWNFGKDFSGNIMSSINMEFLKENIDSSIDLVTADGSIDCSDDPAEQENIVAPLLLWETVTALNILAAKGNFILKIFTIFEKFTICLLYLLSSSFENVTLSKPGPSKAGNSEVYVVCEGYKRDKIFEKLFLTFYQAALNNDISIITKDFELIPKSFFLSIEAYILESCRIQNDNILLNLELFKNPNIEHDNEIMQIKHYIAQRFLNEFKIHQIETCISPLLVMATNCADKKLIFKPNFKKGSFVDRMPFMKSKGDKNKKTPSFNAENDNFFLKWSWYKPQHQCLNYLAETHTFITGKTCLSISYSCFCNPTLLLQYNKLQKNTQNNFLKLALKKLFCELNLSTDSHIGIFSGEIDIDSLSDVLPHCYCMPYKDNSTISLFICSVLFDNKKGSIEDILKLLQMLKSTHSCIFILKELLLSNFWNGIFFIIAQCFEEIAYVHTTTSCTSFLVFHYFKASNETFDALYQHIENVIRELSNLTLDFDVLHVVPIYYLMKSTYRDYVTKENEAFIMKCLK